MALHDSRVKHQKLFLSVLSVIERTPFAFSVRIRKAWKSFSVDIFNQIAFINRSFRFSSAYVFLDSS